MAVTPQDAIDALEDALSRGVTDVTYSDGRRVSYASPKEMLEALAYFRAQARVTAGQPAVKATTGAYYRD